MHSIIITDDKIKYFNIGKKDNEESSIIYKTKDEFHTIVLNICADNYNSINFKFNRCVAERNFKDYTITFFTSGIFTKIIFKNRLISNFWSKKLLSGTRKSRFNKLSELIYSCGFTICDLL